MAIRHWSGRRLAGTWFAGMAGEVVLLALPVAFFAVTILGDVSRDTFVGGGPVREIRPIEQSQLAERLRARDERIARVAQTEARVAEVEARVAEAVRVAASAQAVEAAAARGEAAIRALEAAEARAESRRQTTDGRILELLPPPPPLPERIAFGRPVQEFSSAEILGASPWYAIPMAGAIALYVLAIPLGLLAITFVWMIARFTGSQPPPSSA